MTRSRASAKKAGARFERAVADYLAATIDDRIDRRVKTGVSDRGDIGGIRLASGSRVVIECKDYAGSVSAGPWLDEAETERRNDGAAAGLVVAKRRGRLSPADQIVMMTLADLVAILTGVRP